MERFRFDSGPARDYPFRRLGSENAESLPAAAPVAAARELREAGVQPARECPVETGLARSFVIAQNSIYPQYDLMEGYHRGTIFVSLDKPLTGVGRCDAN